MKNAYFNFGVKIKCKFIVPSIIYFLFSIFYLGYKIDAQGLITSPTREDGCNSESSFFYLINRVEVIPWIIELVWKVYTTFMTF